MSHYFTDSRLIQANKKKNYKDFIMACDVNIIKFKVYFINLFHYYKLIKNT